MKLKANVFSYFVYGLYLAAVFYILVCGMDALGTGAELPHCRRVTFLALALCVWLGLHALCALLTRLRIPSCRKDSALAKHVPEAIAALLLALAVAVRIVYLCQTPAWPEEEAGIYVEIAELLAQDSLLGSGGKYCDYIALFPGAFGYPYALSVVFRLFGGGMRTAWYFNAVLSVVAVLLVWRIGRRVGGKAVGLAAMAFAAFWPSHILHINAAEGDYLYACLMLMALYLLVRIQNAGGGAQDSPEFRVVLHMAFGFVSALASAVRPAALIVLIAAILCIFPERERVQVKRVSEIPVSGKLLSKGWRRCLLILACYMAASGFLSMGVAYSVNRDIAPANVSFGYDLLAGLEQDAAGMEEGAAEETLCQVFYETGSAEAAQRACRDLALQRMRTDAGQLIELFGNKFSAVWANDGYTDSYIYLLVVFGAFIEGAFAWKKGISATYPIVLVSVGNMLACLFVRIEAAAHFSALFLFILLASDALKHIYGLCCEKAGQAAREKENERLERKREWEKLFSLEAEEKELQRLREEAMGSRFDMEGAIEKGYVQVSVSESYQKENRKCAEKKTEN